MKNPKMKFSKGPVKRKAHTVRWGIHKDGHWFLCLEGSRPEGEYLDADVMKELFQYTQDWLDNHQ